MFDPKQTDEKAGTEELRSSLAISSPLSATIFNPIGTGCMACCSGNPEPLGGLYAAVE